MLLLRAFLGCDLHLRRAAEARQPLLLRRRQPRVDPGAAARTRYATSPIGTLLRPAAHAPVLIGLLIAFGELAVGLGTLVGLFGRLAAAGGMVLSLILFLTVSFNTTPYFYGSDIVFLFAWTPFVIAGSGAWSLDAVLAKRHAQELASAGLKGGSSRAGPGPPCGPEARSTATVALGSFAAVTAGIVAAVGRMFGTAAAGARRLHARTAATGVTIDHGRRQPDDGHRGDGHRTRQARFQSAARRQFTDPAQQIPAYVVQPSQGAFVAFSAVCTHMGCTVGFDQPALQFRCPCHGSIFSAITGEVIQGPATLPLPGIPVTESDGNLLADG